MQHAKEDERKNEHEYFTNVVRFTTNSSRQVSERRTLLPYFVQQPIPCNAHMKYTVTNVFNAFENGMLSNCTWYSECITSTVHVAIISQAEMLKHRFCGACFKRLGTLF